MALTQDLAGQLATAYAAGDTTAVNNLLQQNQVSAGDVQDFWKFTPEQTAATGLNFYQPPAQTGIAGLQDWYAQNPTTDPNLIAYQMQQRQVTPEQVATAFNLDPTQVQQTYQAALPYVNVYNAYQAGDVGATNTALQQSKLTPEQLATAFGLDPAEMTDLRQRGYGVGATKGEITGAFGTSATPGYADLNRGFEWAQANKIDDAALKSALGESTYNSYMDRYGQGILAGLRPMLADNRVSPEEALDVVTQAKKYGLDANDISKYTGLKLDVPKAFFDTYDSTLTGIVGNVLDPKSKIPEADRAKSILALQSKYGLTDADLARYSGGKTKTQDWENYFSPVRNFGKDFQTLYNDPKTTAKDIVDFIDRSKGNTVISSIYGDRLAQMEPQIAEFRRLADIGTIKDYRGKEYDPLTLTRLYSQVAQNFDKESSKGGAFGSQGETIGFTASEANKLFGKEVGGANQIVLDIARHLMDLGITDISQATNKDRAGTTLNLGETTVGKGRTQYNLFYDPETGKPTFGTEAKVNNAGLKKAAPLIALGLSLFGIPALANAISGALPGAAVTGGAGAAGAASGIGFIPATAMNTTISNALASGLISGGISDLAGGSFGKGFLSGGLGPLLNLGIGSLLPADMGNLAKQAITGGLTSGIMSDLAGGNFGKGLLSGALNPLVTSQVSDLLPKDINPTIGRTITNTAGNLVNAAVTGQPVGNVLESGILSGALNYGLGKSGVDLTPAQQNIVSGIVLPTVLGKKVSPYSLLTTLARSGQLAQTPYSGSTR